jgi:tryptophan-rich sensory protein
MTIAIVQLVIGLLLLAEVCGRIFGWTYPTDFTYRICRPFWIPFPMYIGVIISFAETVFGAVLTYRGIVELIQMM